MRLCLVLSVIVVIACAGAWAAPAGPLLAGTAPGAGGPVSPEFHAGVHYPDYVSVLSTMPAGVPPPMPNYSAPYSEWPDPALVPGHRPAMTSDIVIMASHRRGTPHKTPICE
jgi:hypothetical protein